MIRSHHSWHTSMPRNHVSLCQSSSPEEPFQNTLTFACVFYSFMIIITGPLRAFRETLVFMFIQQLPISEGRAWSPIWDDWSIYQYQLKNLLVVLILESEIYCFSSPHSVTDCISCILLTYAYLPDT